MGKRIAIYFSDSEPLGYPLNISNYFESYSIIISDLEAMGIDVVIVRGDSYAEKGVFKNGWRFAGDELVECGDEIRADLIFNRDDKNTIPLIKDCKVINNPEFDLICIDKLKTFEIFGDISPRTFRVDSYETCIELLEKHDFKKEEIVVLKKNFSLGGHGVFVGRASKINEKTFSDWDDVLLQEFLDCSVGVPGITDEKHDLRITVMNGSPVASLLRTPQKGGYIANTDMGGTTESIRLEDVPKEVFKLVNKINKKADMYRPSLYSADFANTPKGYKLIELNSRPGVPHPYYAIYHKDFNEALIRMLAEEVA